MNGYINKQLLMDYCSNQVPRTIDLNDIARFPVAKVFTKDEVIAMFKDLQSKLNQLSFIEDNGQLIVITPELMDEAIAWQKGIEDCNKVIQEELNALRRENMGIRMV